MFKVITFARLNFYAVVLGFTVNLLSLANNSSIACQAHEEIDQTFAYK